jgi:hypothetical protein
MYDASSVPCTECVSDLHSEPERLAHGERAGTKPLGECVALVRRQQSRDLSANGGVGGLSFDKRNALAGRQRQRRFEQRLEALPIGGWHYRHDVGVEGSLPV